MVSKKFVLPVLLLIALGAGAGIYWRLFASQQAHIFCADNESPLSATHITQAQDDEIAEPELVEAITRNESGKPLNVIFDLNGVLFDIDRGRALNHLGFFETVIYSIGGNSSELENTVFDIMYRMENSSFEEQSTICVADLLIPLYNNKPMPKTMCKWMQGTHTAHEVIEQINTHIEHLDTQDYFKSSREKRLIKKIIHMMFDPETRVQLYEPLHKGIRLVKRCKKLGHKVYLLSNMDSELITLMKEKHPEIFDLFDGTVISADVRMIKPHGTIFHHLLKTYHLDPSTCYFIDDSEENIRGAKHVGINAVHCNPSQYNEVYKELRSHGVLDPVIEDDASSYLKKA